MSEPIVTFGPFTLDASRNELRNRGEVVNVSQRAISLLATLINANGQTVSKSELMEKAWSGTIVEEGNLTVQVAALRKALGSDADGHDWIVTVPREGYRLLLPQVFPAQTAKPIVLPSLAVLPFSNLSGDAGQDYFADGVVEDIITALSRFKSFAVIARNSSFAYKGRAMDVRQVASELGVRYVLEGSVRRAGDKLRISAQLVDAQKGSNLWAQQFDGALDDVFDFQDRITESVTMIVEPQIQIAEIERSRRERPGSLAAYDIYLQTLTKIRAATVDEHAVAYALIEKTLTLEPDNAVFLSQAAIILGTRSGHGWSDLTENAKARCQEMISRALANARDDAVVLAQCSHALTHVEKDYDFGLATALRALEINPNNFTVVSLAGVQNLHCGRLDDALACFRRALRLSPADPNANYALTGIAHAQMVLGDYNEALATSERSLALNASYNPTYWMLIAANAQLGRIEEARRWLAKFQPLAPRVTIAKIRDGQPAKDPSRMAAIFEGLRLAGLPET